MTATAVRRALACAAAITALSAAARAGDPPTDTPDAEKPKVEGDVRTGWRFLSGEGDGRFQQDVGLKDGPRLFEFNALATGLGGVAPVDVAEAHFDGIGDRNSDYLLTVRKRDLLDVSGGYRRDDSVYSASGDIFPYDTLRQRSFVHVGVTPDHALALHLAWDRTTQTADSPNGGYSQILPTGQPLDLALPRTVRFTELTDDFAAGADYATGIWRFGLTQSVRLGQTQQDNSINVTDAGQDVHDDVEQSTRLKVYSTTGKAGVTLFDRTLDVTLFGTYVQSPLNARANGDSLGLDADGNPLAPESFRTDSELRRSDLVWRLETAWRPHKDWEFVASTERGNLVDDESVELGGDLLFPRQTKTGEYRITDRTQRWSGDVMWDAIEGLRLRAGEQYLHEDLFDPTYQHFNETSGTNFSSVSWRTTAGADWTDRAKIWSLGALAHHTTNDHPQTTAVPEYADDWTLRGRWKPTAEISTTLVWRHVAATNSGNVPLPDIGQAIDPNFGDQKGLATNLGSATRSDSVSASGSWTCAPWTVTGTGTVRTFDTTADTAYSHKVNAQDPTDPTATTYRKIFETVAFSGTDVVANLDVRYEFTSTLRAFTDVTGTDATGDYTARWLQIALGAEHDLREDLTAGVTVSTWRLRQQPSGGDNYRTYGAEVSLTYRF